MILFENFNLDGVEDSKDANLVNVGQTLGWNALSRANGTTGAYNGNRKGYAGYESTFFDHSTMHVRNRVYLAELGRWSRRDPIGFNGGMNVYGYAENAPLGSVDPFGLCPVGYNAPQILKNRFNVTICIDINCPPQLIKRLFDGTLDQFLQQLNGGSIQIRCDADKEAEYDKELKRITIPVDGPYRPVAVDEHLNTLIHELIHAIQHLNRGNLFNPHCDDRICVEVEAYWGERNCRPGATWPPSKPEDECHLACQSVLRGANPCNHTQASCVQRCNTIAGDCGGGLYNPGTGFQAPCVPPSPPTTGGGGGKEPACFEASDQPITNPACPGYQERY